MVAAFEWGWQRRRARLGGDLGGGEGSGLPADTTVRGWPSLRALRLSAKEVQR